VTARQHRARRLAADQEAGHRAHLPDVESRLRRSLQDRKSHVAPDVDQQGRRQGQGIEGGVGKGHGPLSAEADSGPSGPHRGGSGCAWTACPAWTSQLAR
jgi:hypothetical protein